MEGLQKYFLKFIVILILYLTAYSLGKLNKRLFGSSELKIIVWYKIILTFKIFGTKHFLGKFFESASTFQTGNN